MIVFQGQNFYPFNFIKIPTSKKLVILWYRLKIQDILQFWVKFYHYWLGLALDTQNPDSLLIFFPLRGRISTEDSPQSDQYT